MSRLPKSLLIANMGWRWPIFKEAKNAVLVLDMRGCQTIFETSVEFAEKCVAKLHASGNLLMLCNVSDTVVEQIKATEAYELIGAQNIFQSSPVIGASLEEAWQAAEQWITERQKIESASAAVPSERANLICKVPQFSLRN